jgi:small subunit ribosomal protein S20
MVDRSMDDYTCGSFSPGIDNLVNPSHSSPPLNLCPWRKYLANSAQARKRARQAERRRQHNASRKSLLRTRIKQINRALEQGDKEAAEAAYKNAVPVIDRMAAAMVIHKNKAARHKSRLNARIKAMA